MNSKIPLIKLSSSHIPQIGFGTYQLKDEICYNAVKIALKSGYRHIDTARIYKNEIPIQKALEESYNELNLTRKDIFITSKLGPDNQGFENALSASEYILNTLKTDYIDLLLIHWPGIKGTKKFDDPNIAKTRLETWKAMEKLVDEGKVKEIGVSNFTKIHLEHLLINCRIKPCINQFEIHPFCIDFDVIEFCKQKDIVVEAYSSLARNEDFFNNNSILKEIAGIYNKSIHQIALRWALQKGFVIIPKSQTEKYIFANLDILDFEISEEKIKLIDNLNEDRRTCWNPYTVLV